MLQGAIVSQISEVTGGSQHHHHEAAKSSFEVGASPSTCQWTGLPRQVIWKACRMVVERLPRDGAKLADRLTG